ncbi:YggT family protein [Staphylococcus phage VB-SauS-SA2]|nr:YggT family protein [Staphylococcus phage VB-SauS-SA2]
MTNLTVYYILNLDNEYIYHATNESEFIESALRYFKTELFETVENYKTYVLNQDEYLEEMERFINIRKKIKECENIAQLKYIATSLDFKIKIKTIDLD